MDTSNYASLTRQTGLLREMQIIANNIANSATTGFRQEGVMFSEFVAQSGDNGLSMAHGNVARTSHTQGGLSKTGNVFDLAVEGSGFFMVETPNGPRLTRAGNFTPMPDGSLLTPMGYPVLSAAQSPVFVPPGVSNISIARDGSMSANGQIIDQIGVFDIDKIDQLRREDGVLFAFDGDAIAAKSTGVLQGFLENSNSDPLSQIARMITVQRAYELGQSFNESEDERIRNAVKTILK